MRFLSCDEGALIGKRLRREIAEYAKPKFILYYDSGQGDYSLASQAIASAAGKFTEATLLFMFAVSGDGWNDDLASNVRWGRYRNWREAMGESRRLYDSPCHVFGAEDVQKLSKVIAFALDLGWDAIVSAKPGRQLIFLSHDDRVEIYRGFEGRDLVRKLTRLERWRRGET